MEQMAYSHIGQVASEQHTNLEEGEDHEPVQSYRRNRKVSLVVLMIVVVASCVVFVATRTKSRASNAYRAGSHPGFVSYAALPVDRKLHKKPELCDPKTVQTSCTSLNGGVAAMSVSVFLLSQLCDASESSVTAFLTHVNISSFEQSMGVLCQELCEKVVATFPAEELPSKSYVACTQVAGAQANCGPVANPSIANSSGVLDGNSFEGPPITSLAASPVSDGVALAAANQGSKSFGVLRTTIVRFFEIYPIVRQSIQQPAGVAAAAPIPGEPAGIIEDVAKVQVALNRAILAIGRMGLNPNSVDGKVFIRWFGSMDSKADVLHMLNSVNDRIAYDPKSIAWVMQPSCIPTPGEKVYAYTTSPETLDANGHAIIYLCPKYFDGDKLTQLEALTIEVSHLQPMTSLGYMYGYDPCQQLAYGCKKGNAAKCVKARENGASYAYYVFDANGDYTGSNTFSNRAQTWAHHYASTE